MGHPSILFFVKYEVSEEIKGKCIFIDSSYDVNSHVPFSNKSSKTIFVILL